MPPNFGNSQMEQKTVVVPEALASIASLKGLLKGENCMALGGGRPHKVR